jgi:hypothetical protein
MSFEMNRFFICGYDYVGHRIGIEALYQAGACLRRLGGPARYVMDDDRSDDGYGRDDGKLRNLFAAHN